MGEQRGKITETIGNVTISSSFDSGRLSNVDVVVLVSWYPEPRHRYTITMVTRSLTIRVTMAVAPRPQAPLPYPFPRVGGEAEDEASAKRIPGYYVRGGGGGGGGEGGGDPGKF